MLVRPAELHVPRWCCCPLVIKACLEDAGRCIWGCPRQAMLCCSWTNRTRSHCWSVDPCSLLWEKKSLHKNGRLNYFSLFGSLKKNNPDTIYIPFARIIEGKCADIVRPAFYSELEFYEWNLCGETEPFHTRRGENRTRTIRCWQLNVVICGVQWTQRDTFYLQVVFLIKCVNKLLL